MTESQTTPVAVEPTGKIYATWHVSLDCECPKCGEYVDLLEAQDFWDGHSFQIPEHGTNRTENVEVICPKCEGEFHVKLEY